jgi:hypothetical protein
MKPGDIFSKLTVLYLIRDRKNPKAACACECGKIIYPQRGALVNGKAKSCGCYRFLILTTHAKTHGMSKSPEYKAFMAMHDRCNNNKNKAYKNYGERGISVLYKDFQEFFADVGIKPAGAWIDRIDNNKSYQIGNCRWVTPKLNQENKRVSKIWIIDGKEFKSSTDAAKFLGVDVSVINRGCNGYTRNGRTYQPRDGWKCELKYQ